MKFSLTENNFSDDIGRGEPMRKIYFWDLHPELGERFVLEQRPAPGSLQPMPAPEEWAEHLPECGMRVLLTAADQDGIPREAIEELITRRRAVCMVLLPEVDERIWRRLTRQGFVNVLAPPFRSLNLDLEFSLVDRQPALSQRLPDLDARIRSKVEFNIPGDLRYVAPGAGFICRLAREHAYPPEIWAERLPLALDEALSNAIVHGCASDATREIKVKVWLQHDVMKIVIEDPGEGFDVGNLPVPTDEPHIHRGNGRGVLLMQEMMDRVSYDAGGRILTLHVQRSPGRTI